MSRREDMRRTYLALLVAVPARQRDKYALALCVRVLDLLAKNALLDAETVLAGAMADAIRHRVPSDIARRLSGKQESGQ